jgi:hypothetical protein
MSVEAMAWAYTVTLPPCPKSVLVALANRADEDGHCWPGIEDLEQRTGWGRRAIQTAIKDLRARQLLSVSPRFSGATGQQQTNLYRLALSTADTPSRCGGGASPAPRGVHQVRGGGASPAPPGVHQLHGEGAPGAPESSSEQSEEQSLGIGHAAPAPPTTPPVVGETKRSGKPRGHRASVFPDDWDVEPWMTTLCQGFGLNPHAEFAEFKNNHKAKGSLFASWPHAFRTWVSRSVKFKQQRRG